MNGHCHTADSCDEYTEYYINICNEVPDCAILEGMNNYICIYI
jgi:hypothetical protein